MHFTHLLVEARSKYSLNLRPYLQTFEILDSVEGFWHISFNYNNFPPIQIKTRPHVFILKRKPAKIMPTMPSKIVPSENIDATLEQDDIEQTQETDDEIDEEYQQNFEPKSELKINLMSDGERNKKRKARNLISETLPQNEPSNIPSQVPYTETKDLDENELDVSDEL
jgi:alpha-1,6-mannosyltransferase